MKQLNTHLETRLEEQERRLCLVTSELTKTWNVVGRLRRHHHQLHTHEKILKYELQQKRKLLNELKEELEYCREKWEQAREKNTQSEKDWKKLRIEFSNRKLKPDLASINNSAESGYSDEKPSDESSESNDECEYVETKIKCKKRIKKTFETNVDSSADFNLTAEREDPVSDMLDVAELPLDTQEDNHECDDVSDSFNSESLFKYDKLCEETEDEAADMTNEENSIAERSPDFSLLGAKEDVSNETTQNSQNSIPGTSTDTAELQISIDPAAILKSIREQNERLTQKDKRLERLESSGSNLLRKTQTIARISDQINSTLDNILNRPTSSKQTDDTMRSSRKVMADDKSFIGTENEQTCNNSEDYQNTNNVFQNVNVFDQLSDNSDQSSENNPSSSDLVPENPSNSANVDFSAILDNVKKQNERLQLKDKRLESLEQGCTEIVENISNTINSGSTMITKLDNLHEKYNKTDTNETKTLNTHEENEICDTVSEKSNENGGLLSENSSGMNMEEPSSSREIDHEARFAARDLRLKRLEEQTKSLVNKVNKTATKGVKINYKLEELHNIYGSENSRSGTPSEDTEDTSQNDDDPLNE